MKILLPLALAGSVFAGMHGYNTCYLASSSGISNLSVSSIGLHIDSVWHAQDNKLIHLTFKDGYLVRNDEIRDEAYVRHGDTLTSVYAGGSMSQEFVVDQDLIVRSTQIGAGGRLRMVASTSYAKDTIVRLDSMSVGTGAGNSVAIVTRNVFTVDSMYTSGRLDSVPGIWYPSRHCKASPSACSCSDSTQWILSAGKIEEWHDTLTAIYYTSTMSGTSVRTRLRPSTPLGTDFWRADGSRRNPIRGWMPVYKAE